MAKPFDYSQDFRTIDFRKHPERYQIGMFLEYGNSNDFVGMDMARKFLQMGWTRSRRYANHKTGRKWNAARSTVLPLDVDVEKAASAAIFFEYYQRARHDAIYLRLMAAHRQNYEQAEMTHHAKKPSKISRKSSAINPSKEQ